MQRIPASRRWTLDRLRILGCFALYPKFSAQSDPAVPGRYELRRFF